MTLLEFLKKAFGDKLDQEIKDVGEVKDIVDDIEVEESTSKEKGDKSKTEDGGGISEEDTPEKEDEKVSILESGWFNEQTGEIDTSKVKDADVLAALNKLNSRAKAVEERGIIESALDSEISKLQLTVTGESFKKLLDTSKFKVVDGKVEGVKEAIDNIRTGEPSLFRGKIEDDKSNPLNEGHDPVEQKNTQPKTWEEAFAAQSATGAK